MALSGLRISPLAPSAEDALCDPVPKDRQWVLLRRFSRHRLALVGAIVIAVLTLAAIFATHLLPYDPDLMNLGQAAQPPSREHPLGTDLLGRDVLTRTLHAGRVSLSVGVVAVGIYTAIALVLGGVAGFYGGRIDSVLMRITDTMLCFPTLIIIITLVSVVGPSIYNVMIVIGLFGWPFPARLVRGQFLTLRQQEFVESAHCLGASDFRVMTRHLIPNTLAPLIVAVTFGIANTILLEAGLSFLGLGVQPPTASWGGMLTETRSIQVLEKNPWIWMPAGFLLAICVISINFVGDGLRDVLDPRWNDR